MDEGTHVQWLAWFDVCFVVATAAETERFKWRWGQDWPLAVGLASGLRFTYHSRSRSERWLSFG